MFRSLIAVTAALVWLCAPTNTSAEPFINQIMVNGINYAYHTDAYFKNLRETFCTAIHSDHKWYCDQDTEELEKRWHKIHFRVRIIDAKDETKVAAVMEEIAELAIEGQEFEREHDRMRQPPTAEELLFRQF